MNPCSTSTLPEHAPPAINPPERSVTIYAPPQPEHEQLIRAALAAAADLIPPRGAAATADSKPAVRLARRARLLTAAINALPTEQQPNGWRTTDDPHAEAAMWKAKLDLIAELGRDASAEAEELRADRDATALFSITWDHDFVSLWCSHCAGEQPVEVFPGNPTDMAEIFDVMRRHRAEQHPDFP
jgi:hypothetical protein